MGNENATLCILLDLGAQITLSPIRIDLLRAPHPDRSPYASRGAAQTLKRGSDEDFKADKRRDRISWQANEWNLAIFAKCQRLSGAHVDAPEIQLPIGFDHLFDKIKCAYAHAG